VSRQRYSAKAEYLPSAKAKALGKYTGFAECKAKALGKYTGFAECKGLVTWQ